MLLICLWTPGLSLNLCVRRRCTATRLLNPLSPRVHLPSEVCPRPLPELGLCVSSPPPPRCSPRPALSSACPSPAPPRWPLRVLSPLCVSGCASIAGGQRWSAGFQRESRRCFSPSLVHPPRPPPPALENPVYFRDTTCNALLVCAGASTRRHRNVFPHLYGVRSPTSEFTLDPKNQNRQESPQWTPRSPLSYGKAPPGPCASLSGLRQSVPT